MKFSCLHYFIIIHLFEANFFFYSSVALLLRLPFVRFYIASLNRLLSHIPFFFLSLIFLFSFSSSILRQLSLLPFLSVSFSPFFPPFPFPLFDPYLASLPNPRRQSDSKSSPSHPGRATVVLYKAGLHIGRCGDTAPESVVYSRRRDS